LGQLFDELKRRNVFRVAVAYVVSAWLVLQVADVVINNIGAPEWVFSVFMLAGALLLLPVLFFSWAYELTPDGIKRESEVDRSHSITRNTGRKLDLITIGMLVAVVAFVLVERTWMSQPGEVAVPKSADEASSEVTETTASDKSIAVLAFDDLSPEGNQAFFAEGLSEEILNVLAQVPGLKVAGRTSSFAFQGKGTDLREIGEILNVAHILEGSVRKAGDRIRVTAQLIQASDGFHLFSRTYDRDLTDVFAVQDDLAALIGGALQTELTGEDSIPVVAQTNIKAYDMYLLARQRIHSRNPELMMEALELLEKALEIDANYAPALAQRALVLNLLSDGMGSYGDIPEAIATEEGLSLIERALEINPRLAEAHAVFGLITYDLPGRRDEAIASLQYALELNPNMDDGKNWLANAIDDFEKAAELYEEVLLRDPLYGPAFNNLIQSYMDHADFDRSEALIARIARITGPDDNVRQALGTIAVMRGDLSGAVRDLGQAYDANPNAEVVKVWLAFAHYLIGDMERAAEIGSTSQSIAALASLGEFDHIERLIEEPRSVSGNKLFLVNDVASYLVQRGRANEVVDFVNDNHGDVATLLRNLPVVGYFGTQYLAPLAVAYSQAGLDDEYQLLVETMESALDVQRARGSDSWIHWYSKAQYAVLTGDIDAATSHLQTALDRGYVSAEQLDPVMDLIADDKRFVSLTATALARANQERAKLGMEPYRRPLRFE